MEALEKHNEEEAEAVKTTGWWGLSVGMILVGQAWLEAGPRLCLQHADGRLGIWELEGSQFAGSRLLESGDGNLGAALAGVGDFDGDGGVDWLLNHSDYRLIVASPTEFALTNPIEIGQVEGEVVLVHDWNGDSLADLLVGSENGLLSVYQAQGDGGFETKKLRVALPDTCQVIGVGDFDRDGQSDLVVADAERGVAAWLLRGGARFDTIPWILPGQLTEGWRALGMGDFDHDGLLDLALQHEDGRLAFWGGTRLEAEVLDRAPADPAWRVVAVDAGPVVRPGGFAGDPVYGIEPIHPPFSGVRSLNSVRASTGAVNIFGAASFDAEIVNRSSEWPVETNEVYLEIWLP